MHVILVLWHVKKGKEKEFIDAWKEKFYVNDREKLIGEFLSKPMESVDDMYKTWTVANYSNPAEPISAFVNVGLWESFAAFKAQIDQYIPAPGAPTPDWQVARFRIALEPIAWRVGLTNLVRHDTARTF